MPSDLLTKEIFGTGSCAICERAMTVLPSGAIMDDLHVWFAEPVAGATFPETKRISVCGLCCRRALHKLLTIDADTGIPVHPAVGPVVWGMLDYVRQAVQDGAPQ